jgi:hypothetical protein
MANPLRCIALMLPVSVRTLVVSTALLSSAVNHAWAQPQSSGPPRRITLGVVEPAAWKRDSTNTSSIRGTTLGIEEGQRTASMFGWELVVKRPGDSLSTLSALRDLALHGTTAVIGDFSGLENPVSAPPATTLILDIGGSAEATRSRCRDTRFRIAPDGASSLRAWHPALERYGAAQLNERYRKRFGGEMDDRAWAGWMAVKILVDAALKTGNSDPRSLETYLMHSGRFDGHKGVPLSFDSTTRELVQPLVAVAANGEPELVRAEARVVSHAARTASCSGE